MSSWSSSYPPPPRRSRSRSPPPRSGYSSGRAPHPDLYEDYRAGYDSYDRDRWQYDRDRYDYGRRRSRSPPLDEPGRKRRRSMSPYDRERYDPRPRYSDDYDAHSRRDYSPRRHSGPSRRAPPDPHHFDYPASLKQYADWFRYTYPTQAMEEDAADKQAEQEAGDGSKPRNGIKTRWEKYKKEFSATQLQTMFEHHRKSPWFAEKYDPAPDFENLRKRVRKEGWKTRLNNFLDDLEAGNFDPDLHEPVEVEPKSPKENGAGDASEEVKPPVDEDTTFNADADEDGGDHDATRNDTNGKSAGYDRRNNRGEEISVPTEGNQVMIRTIPPDIGRVKLEEACSKIPGFIYLALGDPLQKRNYYRAGWLRFKDDADMDSVMSELTEKKIEGFKLHVTHNLRPFVNKIRYAPEVASRPDRLEKDLANAIALAKVLEDRAEELRVWKMPPPAPANKGEDGKAEAQDAEMTPVEEEDVEPAPKERGSEAVARRIEKVMLDIKEQGLVDANDEKAFEAKKVVVSLDMYLAYLRAAFHTCYYCAVVTDHLEELQRKCLKHERKPLSKMALQELRAEEAEKEEKEREKEREKEQQEKKANEEDGDKEMQDETDEKPKVKENGNATTVKPRQPLDKDARDWKRNDERWVEWLEQKVALLINRDGVDPRIYGGKSYEEELSKAVEPYLKQEDEGKFRCKTCQKLFKATAFVEKHIANKHPELVKQLEDLPYFNNFALDPHHIQPFAHPPTVVGNASQAPPPQAYGIQAPMFQGGDYGRGGGGYYGGGGGGGPYNMPGGGFPYYNGQWAEFPGGYPPGGYPPQGGHSSRRLSDRLGGFADGNSVIPAGAGLPPKPTPAALDTALVSGNGPPGGGRRNNRQNSSNLSGPPPPPPPDAKEDPRAAGGKRVSYHDMDLVAEGDVELMY